MVPHPKGNILVATETEAAAGALLIAADGEHSAVLYGIDDSSIAALEHVIVGMEYEAGSINPSILRNHKLIYTYNEMHGGWLFRFPDETVSALAALGDYPRLPRMARAWSKIFESDDSPPTSAQVENTLSQIVALAKNALRTGNSLFWLAPDC